MSFFQNRLKGEKYAGAGKYTRKNIWNNLGKLSDYYIDRSRTIFTILTKGIQIKGFPLAVRELINSLKGEKEVKGEGTLSSFQALCTALSSCVGMVI